MSELKCCPFCGGEAILVKNGAGCYQVACNNCEVRQYAYSHKNKESAIKAWNTRKPMANIVEKLEEESKKKHNKERDVLCKIANASYSAGVEYSINIVKQEINNGLE